MGKNKSNQQTSQRRTNSADKSGKPNQGYKNNASGDKRNRFNHAKPKSGGNKPKPNGSKEEFDKDGRRVQEIANTEERMVSQTNDFSWYNKFPQFTRDAGTLAFGIPVGQSIELPNGDVLYNAGVMALRFYPTVGYSEDNNSPINRAQIRFMTYLRDVQKAAARYDGADVVMTVMSLDSAFMFWSLMRRAYGVAQLYTPLNKYYPRVLLQMMGFDPNIANNLAEFRAYINRYAIQLGSYSVPKDFEITKRHQWMCEGLYLDSNTTRAQTYMFVPEGFWQFNNTVTTGSQLDFVQWMPNTSNVTLHTLSQVQQIGDSLINAIRNDQDTGNIVGDLYRAFGPENLRRLEETPDMFSVLPVYDEVVLSQIENATLVGVWGEGYTPVISQDPSVNNGAIIFKPVFAGNSKKYETESPNLFQHFNPLFEMTGKMINMHMDSPSPEQVIEATRLIVSCNAANKFVTNTNNSNFAPTTFGADVVSRSVIAIYNGPATVATIYSNTNAILDGDPLPQNSALEYLAISEQFDWAPLLYLWDQHGSDPSNLDIKFIAGDVDNMTVVSYSQLEMMHEATLLSLLDVPQIGI